MDDKETVKKLLEHLSEENRTTMKAYLSNVNTKYYGGFMSTDILDTFDDEEPDPSILGVIIEDLDRGVYDWKEFEQHLKRAFPSVKYLYVKQNFGDQNYENSTLDVIEIDYIQSCLPSSDITPIYEKVTRDIDINCIQSLRVYDIKKRLIILQSECE